MFAEYIENLPSVKLCCCGGRSCPSLKIDVKNKQIIIIDDAGNKSWVTFEEALKVSAEAKLLIEKYV